MEMKVRTRQEQNIQETWNLRDIYDTEDSFSEDVKRLEVLIKDFSSGQGTLGSGAVSLLSILRLYLSLIHI